MLAPIRGLNPFVGSASADSLQLPRSPIFGAKSFTQPMPRFDVLPREHPSCLTPLCQAQANETLIPVHHGARRRLRTMRGASAGLGVGASALQRVRAGRLRERDPGAGHDELQLPAGSRLDPQLGDQPVVRDADAVPPEHADPEPEHGVDVQRHHSAQAGAGQVRRAAAVPPPQRAAVRRDAERRLRPPHDLHPRAQRPPRRGERRLHRRVLLPGPVLRLSLADRARRALQLSTPRPPTSWRARPTAAAGSPRSRATGTRP